MAKGSSITTYALGLIASLILTLTSFFLVTNHTFNSQTLTIAIFLLAITQLIFQLIFFLHLGRERSPRWNLLVLSFAAIVLLILVIGSIWIMNHLNYNMNHMSPDQIINYMNGQ